LVGCVGEFVDNLDSNARDQRQKGFETTASANDDASAAFEASSQQEEPRTRIIRRAPTSPLPSVPHQVQTTQIPRRPAAWEGAARPGQRGSYGAMGADSGEESGATAAATSAVSFVSGWATAVVATDLIAGWWRSDRLFCLAVGFLALVFALTTVAGVILLLQRRGLGRYLIVAGAVVALLTYGGIFVAGARVAWIVHALPILPVASVVLAMHPQTKRWLVD
jgi:hypothetical protein